LVESNENIDTLIEQLGFKPHYYSPDYKLVNKELMAKAKKLNIKVLPWTVNSLEEMQKLVDLGVAGIITDYPDIAKPLLQK
jgi:glycerophosphoryl diester phosphodiesterase